MDVTLDTQIGSHWFNSNGIGNERTANRRSVGDRIRQQRRSLLPQPKGRHGDLEFAPEGLHSYRKRWPGPMPVLWDVVSIKWPKPCKKSLNPSIISAFSVCFRNNYRIGK
jgi:hypothetical protein